MEAGKSKNTNGPNTIAQEAQIQQDKHGGAKTIMGDSKNIGTNAEAQEPPEFKHGRKAKETKHEDGDTDIVEDILNQPSGSDEQSTDEEEPEQYHREKKKEISVELSARLKSKKEPGGRMKMVPTSSEPHKRGMRGGMKCNRLKIMACTNPKIILLVQKRTRMKKKHTIILVVHKGTRIFCIPIPMPICTLGGKQNLNAHTRPMPAM